MDVSPLTQAPAASAPPTTPSTPTGDFAASLQQALGSAPPPAGRSITLGQMLQVYGSAGTPVALGGGVAGAVPARTAQVMPAATTTGASDALGVGPVARPLPQEINSDYGPRMHPIHGEMRMHHGVDMAAPTGTPIQAFAGGTVTFAGPRGGYGNVVIVEHPNGMETRYAHQSSIDVAVGEQVAAGQVVGRVGSTGLSTGPHLHFELRRNGESIDPAPYLP